MKLGPYSRRTLARLWFWLIASVLMSAGLFGLYEVNVGRHAHLWPVHSRHFLFIWGMMLVWIVVSVALLFGIGRLLATLWDAGHDGG